MTKELVLQKIDGVFSEVNHHAIAAKLKAMSDKWDEIEADTGVRPLEAFDYSFGLLMIVLLLNLQVYRLAT